MKKKLSFGLLFVIVITLSFFTTFTLAAPGPGKPIEIVFCHSLPAQTPAAKVFQDWGKMIEEQSNGSVKFIYYWSNSLLPSAEAIKGVRVGVADVTASFSATQNYMPITYNIMYMPFMGYPSMFAGAEIYEKLYDKFQLLRDEFKGLIRLTSRMYPAVQIHTSKKVVKIPSDLKGLKIACTTSGKLSTLIDMLGGAPVQVHVADINMALNSGVVEGWFDFWPAVKVFGAIPLMPYHTILGDGGISMGLESLIMNPRKFNQLTPEIQKIFFETSAWCGQELMKADTLEVETAEKMAREKNHTFSYLTPEEIKLWRDAAIPLHKQWIEEMESNGKQVREIYDEAKRLINEYSR